MSQKKSRDILKSPMDQSKVIGPLNSPANSKNVFYNAVVVNIDDPLESKRIKCRIESIDRNVPDNKLDWCISLNPSFLFSIPIVGEMVIVFLQNPWDGTSGRYYLGPIASGHLGNYEPFNETKNKLEIPNRGI